MRPRYLEIEGLQSFKELQRVDFDKLSETGLFGIFGPTGSGKSTILDAITLALYGSVYRAAKGTQGIINTDMSGIKVSFTFDLTKEGVRKTYRVERQYKRKKDSESSAEAKVVRLLELSGENEYILADKHNEVNSFVTQLVGLKFEDFTRSVVLPQNKFQEFLLSPRGEKTKMLERIFYLEEYGRRLADKFNRQMALVKNKLSNIDGALSTLGVSSPEALIENERKMTEALERRKEHTLKLKAAEEQYGKGMEQYKLTKEYEELKHNLEGYRSRESEMQRLQEVCLKSEAANYIKPIMKAYKEAKAGFEETNRNLSMLEEKLKALEIESGEAQQRYDGVLKQKEERLPELIRQKASLQECAVLQQELEETLKQLNAARKEYEEIRNQLEAAKKSTVELTQRKDDLNKEVLELEKQSEEQRVDNDRRKQIGQGLVLERELQGLEAGLKKQADKCSELQSSLASYEEAYKGASAAMGKAAADLAGLNQRKAAMEAERPMNREEIGERQSRLAALEIQLQNSSLVMAAIGSLESKLEDYKTQHTKLDQELDATTQALERASAERVELEKQHETVLNQQNHHAAALLAKTLRAGEKCPVCGSSEHPSPAVSSAADIDNSLEQKQAEIQELLDAKQLQIKSLEHELVRLQQQQNSLRELVAQVQLEHEDKKAEHQKLIEQLPVFIKNMNAEEYDAYIMNERELLSKAARTYGEWEQNMQLLQEEIKQQENGLSELKIQESRLAAMLESTKASLQTEQKHLEELRQTQHTAAEEYAQMKQQLGVSSFAQESDRIAQRDEQAQRLAGELKQKRAKLDMLVNELTSALERVNEINDLLAVKKADGIKLKEQKEEKERRIAAVVGDRSLAEELNKVEREMNSLEQSYKDAYDKLNNVKGALEEARRSKAGLRSSLEHYEDTIKGEQEKLQAALAEKNFQSEAEVEACMLDAEQVQRYQEELVKFYREKSSMEDRLQNIEKQLGGNLLGEEKWQQLCSEYEKVKTELENSIAEAEAARNSFMQIKHNVEKWVKLQEELKAQSKKKDMLEQIQKLLKGNGFIEFISDERMRYIAREASVTLGELTKFRYSIELDSENGFVIRDNANGGALRSVASLSGGETFLTSLSLALALSSQLQLKGQSPLEFFFLDEGFGTLDNTLLDTVIDSLERLSNSKRVIGLISHVPEMKSRITRRLIVEAPDRTGKGSRISIEKA